MSSRSFLSWLLLVAISSFFVGGSFVWGSLQAPNAPIVEHSRAAEHAEATEANSKESGDQALAKYTLWLVVVTSALVFATVLLGIATIGLYLTGEKQVRVAATAADAAMLNVKASIGAQAAIIRIQPSPLSDGVARSESGLVEEYCSVHYVTFSNLGASKAFPVELRLGWTVGGDLPALPVYRVTERFLVNTIFAPDLKITPRKYLTSRMPLQSGEATLIKRGDLALWFYCALVYDDFMQVRRETRFCWRFQHYLKESFLPDGGEAYNKRS